MARVFIREGKKGKQIYFDYNCEGVRKRTPSGIYLSGGKMHQKKQLAEALVQCEELERNGIITKESARLVDFIKNIEVLGKESTKNASRSHKKHFIKWLELNGLHNIKQDEFNREMAERYLRYVLDTSNRRASAVTRYKWMKVFFNNGVDLEIIENNPFLLSKRRLDAIFKAYENDSVTHAFTVEEIKRVIFAKSWDKELRYKHYETISYVQDLFLITFLCNGRRLGEILNLKWEDVDFESRYITFKTAKTGQICYVYIGSMLEKKLRELERHRKWHETVLAKKAQTGVSNLIKSILIALGIRPDESGAQGYSHHSIRRCVSTLLINKFGFEIGDFLIGHAPKSVGMFHYYDKSTNNEIYKNAAEYLESLLS